MTDRIRLQGQTAIVTGGGGGIGRGCAIRLAEAGANVVIADNVPERCEEVAARVREAGVQALPYPVDMMDGDATHAMIAAADKAFGRVDILVNNVGGVSGKPFLEQSERSWQRHIELNLMTMLRCTHDVAKIMVREGRGGSIVNVASIEATRAAPMFAVYAACKAGMVSFTRTMAVELAEHRIRVNVIAPDHTVSPGTKGNRGGPVDRSTWKVNSPEEQAAWQQLIPLGYEGDELQCGDAIVFLSSPMAEYITGVLLPVDGGTWASSGWMRGAEGGWTLNQGLRFSAAPPKEG
ncbi:SDR family oxidoreductase [Sphingobium sp. Sx8-8]|uniref:SDR family NAD(P)-dependent oxidoreductase n=1 Tax=Sphingobium sp. Sx8-8 TaxID=2933617 RepID=UPI001F58E303|nr:SDR family oxidoreductase [Sphingobium sp. Sx8-8]